MKDTGVINRQMVLISLGTIAVITMVLVYAFWPVKALDVIRSVGPDNAPVVLEEFSDFQCPACAVYSPIVKKLAEENPEKLKVIFRNFPLMSIHRNALKAAWSAEAAGQQNKFWEMHDLLFSRQDEWADLPDPLSVFEKYATQLQLDVNKFKTDMADISLRQKVRNDYILAGKNNFNGTPSFILNGTALSLKNPEELRKAVSEALAKESTASATATSSAAPQK